MPTLSGLINDRRVITAKCGEHSIRLTYRPSAYSADWARKSRERSEDLTVTEALAESLANALVDWDVTDDDGEKAPISAELLGQLGLGAMNAIDDAIGNDLLPNRRTGRR